MPALARNPVFLYYSDRFTRPQAFRADIVVSIDDVFDKKINMLDAHVSQFYEWLPWTAGQLEQVPKDPAERKKWLAASPSQREKCVRSGERCWRNFMVRSRLAFSTPRHLRSQNTDTSQVRKRFAGSSFLFGDRTTPLNRSLTEDF